MKSNADETSIILTQNNKANDTNNNKNSSTNKKNNIEVENEIVPIKPTNANNGTHKIICIIK